MTENIDAITGETHEFVAAGTHLGYIVEFGDVYKSRSRDHWILRVKVKIRGSTQILHSYFAGAQNVMQMIKAQESAYIGMSVEIKVEYREYQDKIVPAAYIKWIL